MMMLVLGCYEFVVEKVIVARFFFVEELAGMIILCLDKIGMFILNKMVF